MLRSMWRSLFRRPTARPVTRKHQQPKARLRLGHLEDRLTPANVAYDGTVLTFNLDQANEQLSLQLNADGQIQTTTSASFTGLLSGSSVNVIGFTNWVINDTAAGTSVAYLNGGAFVYGAKFNVTLDNASAGITFAGAQKFDGFAQSFTSDKLITASAGSALSTIDQPVIMTTDSLTLTGTLNAGTSSVTLQPFNPGSQVALGGADGAGTLGVDNAEINNVTANTLTVGRNDIAIGSVNVTAAVAVPASVATFSVVTARDIVVNNPLSTVNSHISLSANQQAAPTAGNFTGISVFNKVSSTGAGNITFNGRGGNDAGTGLHIGVLVQLAGSVATGTGNITIAGQGGSGNQNNYGVDVEGGGSVTTADGAIKLTGKGGAGSGLFQQGVQVLNGGTVSATGKGTIEFDGTGGTGSGSNYGVLIANNPAGIPTTVSSNTGSIKITATPGTSSLAFVIAIDGKLVSTGGNISVIADTMFIAQSINAGANSVTLTPKTANTQIALGGADGVGTLGLDSSELNNITAGTLVIGDAASGTITITSDITRPGNLTLKTGAGVTGAADLLVGSAAGTTLTIDQAGTSTYSGSVGGAGTADQKNSALVKTGAGTLKLAGANTYTGTTTIDNGALLVNGSIASTKDLNALTGATLGGIGSIAGNVTIQAGATLSPGDGGVGTLTITGLNLSLQAGSTFLVDIGPGAAADRVNAGFYSIGNGVKLIGTPAQTPLDKAPYQLIGNSSAGSISGAGFVDVNGKSMIPVVGGPVEVGGQQFFYKYAAVGFSLTAGSTSVSVDGGGNLNIDDLLDKDDDLRITRVGANIRIFDPNNTLLAGTGATQVNPNTVDVPFASVTGKINVTTKAGNDSLTLNLAGGILPVGGVDYDGGAAGDDALSVVGSGSETATYTPDAVVTGKGRVSINAGPSIAFTGLEPVDISGMAVATVALAGADDVLDIANGFDDKTGLIPALVVTGTSGGVAIESAHFFSNTTVVIDTTVFDGNDTITITSANNAHANVNLTIKTGAGADSLAVNGQVLLTGTAEFQAATMSFAAIADVISADKLSLDAVNGIGTLLQPVPTDVNSLEARTTTGGIFINNNAVTAGSLTIGGVSALPGLRVTTSGDIQVTNSGSILLADTNGLAVVTAGSSASNVVLTANGATADVSATVNLDAISAPAGDIQVTAGRDILLGTGGISFDNDVRANGSIKFDAGRDIVIDGFSDMAADDFGKATAGTVKFTANRDINLGPSAGNDASVTALSGTITLDATTGAFNHTNGAIVATTGGNITVSADTMLVASTINAGTGVVTLRQAGATARPISLGGGAGAGALGLSDAELAQVTAGVLQIGRTDNTGTINVDGQVTAHAGYSTLALLTGGAVTDGNAAGNDIEVVSLAFDTNGDVGTTADPLETKVTNLAWDTGAGSIDLVNAGALTITTVNGVVGGSGAGHASVTATSPLTVAANVIMGGNVTLTAGEIADAPACADDLTVNAGVTVQSTGGDVNLRAGDDLILTAGSTIQAAAAVRLIAGFGDLEGCGSITFGATIIAGTDLTVCSVEDLTIGALSAPGTVTLSSDNGAIIDGNGAAVNVTAKALAMQASTGIGVGDSLETDVDNIEAQTATGGIFFDNTGDLTVGNVTPDAACIPGGLTGIRATTSGDIVFTNAGSVSVTLNGENVVAQSGDVSITANGATADIVTGGADADPLAAIRTVAGGSIVLDADRDAIIGEAGAGLLWGNVRSFANVNITAGRDVTVQNFSFVDSGTGGGAGDITVVAGRNVNLLSNISTQGRIRAIGSGSISLTTGAGGVFTADAPGGSGVSTNGGDILITADDVVINATAINAGAGCVTIRQVSAAQEIDLGGAGGAGTIGLTDAELDNVTTTSPTGGLTIGRNDAGFTGGIVFSNDITQTGSGYTTIVLTAGGNVTQQAGDTLTVDNLALDVLGSVSLTEANTVTTLAGSAGTFIDFDNTASLTVGTVAACGTNFVGLTGGPICISLDGLNAVLTVANAINAGTQGVHLTADNMALTASVTGTHVTLEAFTAATVIDLGGPDAAGRLGLTQTELDFVVASVLQVGSTTNTGGIEVTEDIARAAGDSLSLLTGSDITQEAGDTLTATNLLAQGLGLGGVNLPEANVVGTLAGRVNAQPFIFNNAASLIIGSASGIENFGTGLDCDGVVNAVAGIDGAPTEGPVCVSVSLADATLTVNAIVDAGTSNALLVADNMSVNTTVTGAAITVAPFTAARVIDLGTNTAGRLAFDQAEIDLFNTTLLQAGRPGVNTGDISITANVTRPDSSTLSLVTGGAIDEGAFTLTGTTAGGSVNLAAQGGAGVNLPNANRIDRLFGAATVAGAEFTVGSTTKVTIDDTAFVSGFGAGLLCAGLGTLGKGITTNNADITLAVFDLEINAAVNAGAECVDLHPFADAQATTLGGEVAGTLSLKDVELDFVTARVLQIGRTSPDVPVTPQSGAINITGAVTLAAAQVATLHLASAGAIAESGAGAITVDNLAVNVRTNSATLAGANDVKLLAAQVDGDFSFTDANDFTIGSVTVCDTSVKGVVAAAANSTINLRGGSGTVEEDEADPGVRISGNLLALEGPAAFNLDAPTNDVVKIQGGLVDLLGSLKYLDDNDLFVCDGLFTNNGRVDLILGGSFTLIPTGTISVGSSNAFVQIGGDDVAGKDGASAQLLGAFVANDGSNLSIFGGKGNNEFQVRPAPNSKAIIYVRGDDPTGTPTGDSLGLDLRNVPQPVFVTPFNDGMGNGSFQFKNGANVPVAGLIDFGNIEQILGQSIQAFAVQTEPGVDAFGNPTPPFEFRIRGTIAGAPTTTSLQGFLPATAPFVAAPQLRNPSGSFRAPQLAIGDVNGDGTPDLIVGFGPDSGSPLVTVVSGSGIFNGTAQGTIVEQDVITRFFAYDPTFQGGLFVASADFDGDGLSEIVTGADAGGGSHVKVFSLSPNPADLDQFGKRNVLLREGSGSQFFAYDPSFHGGVRVATGDVDGDGTPDIITAAGPNGGPHVKVFKMTAGAPSPTTGLPVLGRSLFTDFFAYDAAFRGGVFVDAADVTGDGKADILTGAGFGGGPHIKVFDGTDLRGNPLTQFFDEPTGIDTQSVANLTEYQRYLAAGVTGVAFGQGNTDGVPDVFVGTGEGLRARVRYYAGATTGAHNYTVNQTPVDALGANPADSAALTRFRFGFHIAISGTGNVQNGDPLRDQCP